MDDAVCALSSQKLRLDTEKHNLRCELRTHQLRACRARNRLFAFANYVLAHADLTMVCMIYAIAGYDAQASIVYVGHVLRQRYGETQLKEAVLKVVVEQVFVDMDTSLFGEHLNDLNPWTRLHWPKLRRGTRCGNSRLGFWRITLCKGCGADHAVSVGPL